MKRCLSFFFFQENVIHVSTAIEDNSNATYFKRSLTTPSATIGEQCENKEDSRVMLKSCSERMSCY
jgi:hypothetical protein